MSESVSSQLSKAKKKLRDCRRQLKAAMEMNDRLRSLAEPEELQGWKPNKQVEQMYGWVYTWLHPLSSLMNQHLNKPLTPDVRNKIHDIATAIIAQLAVEGKYGVKLPHDPRPVDFAAFAAKQSRTQKKEYDPCVICGEDRITHECHILPRSEGGPLHKDNFIMLCPLHHHLFDHNRLSRSEWRALSLKLASKMDAAVQYAKEVRLPLLQGFWSSVGGS